jgi:predicted O-methyltransferase YrrM
MHTMGAEVRALLTGLYDRGPEYDAREPEHDERPRNLEPEAAGLVSILVRSGTRLLEMGTSNGYSTIWLARAAAEPAVR